MTDDIDALVKWLRKHLWTDEPPILDRIADAIEALRRERDEARQHALDSQDAVQHYCDEFNAAIPLLREAGEVLEAFASEDGFFAQDVRRARDTLAKIRERLGG